MGKQNVQAKEIHCTKIIKIMIYNKAVIEMEATTRNIEISNTYKQLFLSNYKEQG